MGTWAADMAAHCPECNGWSRYFSETVDGDLEEAFCPCPGCKAPPSEGLAAFAVDAFCPKKRWDLPPGTWAHELVWLPGGFYVGWAHRLEGGDRVNHFAYPDDQVSLVQGAWRRATGCVVRLADLASARR